MAWRKETWDISPPPPQSRAEPSAEAWAQKGWGAPAPGPCSPRPLLHAVRGDGAAERLRPGWHFPECFLSHIVILMNFLPGLSRFSCVSVPCSRKNPE